MGAHPYPSRLIALERPNARLDSLVRLAAKTFGAACVRVDLVNEGKLFAQSFHGIDLVFPSAERAFCDEIFAQPQPFVIADLATKHRTSFAHVALKCRFFAGAKLTTSRGSVFGILSILDHRARLFEAEDLESLTTFAEQISLLFENEDTSARLETAEGHLASALTRNDLGAKTFRAIFDNFPIGVLQLDPQMRFVMMNRAFLDFVGYSEEELLGMSVFDITHRDDLTLTSTAAGAHVSAATVVHRLEKRYVHKSGRILRAQISFRAFHLPGENQHCFFSAIEDLTEIRQREEQLHSAQTQLIESAKFASLGEMAGGIAHEINNPLAIIGVRAEAMLERLADGNPDRERALRDMQVIDATVERISKIIRGLQLFSRSSHNDPMSQSSVLQIVDQTQALCRERFKSAGVELRTGGIADETIECRPTQISQIILNLLGNAFDAITGLKDKWVQIDVQRVGDEILIRVTDAGQGIAHEVAAKMMDPFFTTKEVGKGTGLGLSISRGIAETHGGTLKYDGASPHTAFVLILPIRQAREVAKAA